MSPSDFQRSSFFRSNTWVRVKAAAATAIPPHSVVLITSTTITNNELVYNVRQPNSASADFNWNGYLVTGPFAIGASTNYEGIATEATAPTLCGYDTGSPALKDVYGPKHGQFTLSKGYQGFEVVGSATTSAAVSVVPVRWIGVNEVLIKNETGSAIAAGASGTFNVYIGTAGSETDSGMDLTCYNRSSVSFATSKFGSAGRLNGGSVYAVPWQT